MKQLNLEKVHQILTKVMHKYEDEDECVEIIRGIGHFHHNFNDFIECFCFRFSEDSLIVFNDDPVAWEDFTRDMFIHIPLEILNYSEKQLNEWMCKREEEVLQNNRQILQEEIANIERQIETLKTRLQHMKENIS